MSQETSHTSFEIGPEVLADVEAITNNEEQAALRLARTILKAQEDRDKIDKFIRRGIDNINQGTLIDPREIEGEF